MTPGRYNALLLFVSGWGALLYADDIGILGAGLTWVKSHGSSLMDASWAACTVGCFLVAAFLLPETP